MYISLLKHETSVNLRIQSKCEKIRTRKNSVFGHFSRSADFIMLLQWSDVWNTKEETEEL